MPALLQRLVADDPGAPRVTFYAERYAQTGERVELSARVLSTWVAKTANLLEEEFGTGPGSVVALDLPTHWRTLVWQLAAWSSGAAVLLGGSGSPADAPADAPADVTADVFISHDADALRRDGSGEKVAVSLAPLARSFGTDVPAGVLDYARVVTGYGDTHSALAAPGPADVALVGAAGAATTFGSLLADAVTAGAQWPVGVRLLTDVEPGDVVRGPLAAWARGGSVVLTPDLAALPADVRAQERVEADLPRG